MQDSVEHAYAAPSPAESIPSSQGTQQDLGPAVAALPPVRIQVPAFWRTKPKAWFAFIKASLRSHGWRSEGKIRDAIIANLPEDVLSHLGDALLDLGSLSLDGLEERILSAFRTTPEPSRLEAFLDALAPGAQEPEAALRTIREFCGGPNAKEETLLTFLNRVLHPEVKKQMAAFKGEAIDLYCRRAQSLHSALLASAPAAPATAAHPSTHGIPPPYTAAAAEARAPAGPRGRSPSPRWAQENRPRYDDRRSSPARARRFSGSPGRNGYNYRSPAPANSICYYHYQFGDEAYYCKRPCAWYSRHPSGQRHAPDPPRKRPQQQQQQQPQRGRAQNRRNSRSHGGGRNNSREYYSPERDHHYEEPYNKSQGNA